MRREKGLSCEQAAAEIDPECLPELEGGGRFKPPKSSDLTKLAHAYDSFPAMFTSIERRAQRSVAPRDSQIPSLAADSWFSVTSTPHFQKK